jgi:hypothetical protein
MKKFVYLYHGYQEPSPAVMDAWMSWFGKIGDKLVDPGNPFGPGRQVTPAGSTDLTDDTSPATGYSIINAETIDEAEALLDGCPIISSVRIYEAMPM